MLYAKFKILYRLVSSVIVLAFTMNLVLPPDKVFAQGQEVSLSVQAETLKFLHPRESFKPLVIRGLLMDKNDPLKFNFIVDRGQTNLSKEDFNRESIKLVKYFLTSLTVPDEQMWVNLSPYEKDRIVGKDLGKTEMGKDLLSQDYILKQLTGALMSPEEKLGKDFWTRVYKETQSKFNTTELPTNSFNKVWIIPDEAEIYENERGGYIVSSHLKVMMEQDYLGHPKKETRLITSIYKIIKEILIPEIEKEVNTGKTFANLRQIVNSMILSTWFKKKLKDSLLAKVYVNKGKIGNLENKDKEEINNIYNRYVDTFKKGVFNFIKEEYDPKTQTIIPRKYFCGGVDAAHISYKSPSGIDADIKKDKTPKELVQIKLYRGDQAQIVEALKKKLNSAVRNLLEAINEHAVSLILNGVILAVLTVAWINCPGFNEERYLRLELQKDSQLIEMYLENFKSADRNKLPFDVKRRLKIIQKRMLHIQEELRNTFFHRPDIWTYSDLLDKFKDNKAYYEIIMKLSGFVAYEYWENVMLTVINDVYDNKIEQRIHARDIILNLDDEVSNDSRIIREMQEQLSEIDDRNLSMYDAYDDLVIIYSKRLDEMYAKNTLSEEVKKDLDKLDSQIAPGDLIKEKQNAIQRIKAIKDQAQKKGSMKRKMNLAVKDLLETINEHKVSLILNGVILAILTAAWVHCPGFNEERYLRLELKEHSQFIEQCLDSLKSSGRNNLENAISVDIGKRLAKVNKRKEQTDDPWDTRSKIYPSLHQDFYVYSNAYEIIIPLSKLVELNSSQEASLKYLEQVINNFGEQRISIFTALRNIRARYDGILDRMRSIMYEIDPLLSEIEFRNSRMYDLIKLQVEPIEDKVKLLDRIKYILGKDDPYNFSDEYIRYKMMREIEQIKAISGENSQNGDKAQGKDKRAEDPGGIDLNSANLNLKISSNKAGIKFTVPEVSLENYTVDSFVPVIIGTKSIDNLAKLLQINK